MQDEKFGYYISKVYRLMSNFYEIITLDVKIFNEKNTLDAVMLDDKIEAFL